MMPPLWYIDYFVANKFADCKVYVLMFIRGEYPGVKDNVFYVDLDHLAKARVNMGRFVSPHEMVTIVFAEKGERSTTDRLPNQQDYRSAAEWDEYLSNLATIQKSTRGHLVRSRSEQVFAPLVNGHSFVDEDYRAVS